MVWFADSRELLIANVRRHFRCSALIWSIFGGFAAFLAVTGSI
jgi:hypothetical protein